MIVPEIMRVGFKYIAKTNSGYTAIRILRLIPSPLVIRQGINNVQVNGDASVTKTYPVAFTKFQLPMCVNHTGNFSGWAYCTNTGGLTSVKIYATHEWMNLAVVAIGV